MTNLPFHRNTPSDKNNVRRKQFNHFEENAVRGDSVETKTIFHHDFHLQVGTYWIF